MESISLRYLIKFLSLVCLFSCTNKFKKISNILPSSFKIDSIVKMDYEMPGYTIIYYYYHKKNSKNSQKIFQYPLIKIDEKSTWEIKKWHNVKNEIEGKRLIGYLDVLKNIYYDNIYNNKKDSSLKFLNIIETIKRGIKTEKVCVSYYYNDYNGLGYFSGGYYTLYCLIPDEKKMIYIGYSKF